MSHNLFIANGVTGVRQMFGNSDLLRWRDQIAKGSLLSPRMMVASQIIDGPQPIWPNSLAVRNEEEGQWPSFRSQGFGQAAHRSRTLG